MVRKKKKIYVYYTTIKMDLCKILNPLELIVKYFYLFCQNHLSGVLACPIFRDSRICKINPSA